MDPYTVQWGMLVLTTLPVLLFFKSPSRSPYMTTTTIRLLILLGLVVVFSVWNLYLLYSYYYQIRDVAFLLTWWSEYLGLGSKTFDEWYLEFMLWGSCFPSFLLAGISVWHLWSLRLLPALNNGYRLRHCLRVATKRMGVSDDIQLVTSRKQIKDALPYARQGFFKRSIVIPDPSVFEVASDKVIIGIFAHELVHLKGGDGLLYGVFRNVIFPYVVWSVIFLALTITKPAYVSVTVCLPPLICVLGFTIGYVRMHLERELVADKIASLHSKTDLLAALWWSEAKAAKTATASGPKWAGFADSVLKTTKRALTSVLKQSITRWWGGHPTYRERRRLVSTSEYPVYKAEVKYWISFLLVLSAIIVYLVAVFSGNALILMTGVVCASALGKHLWCADYTSQKLTQSRTGNERMSLPHDLGYAWAAFLGLLVALVVTYVMSFRAFSGADYKLPDEYSQQDALLAMQSIGLIFGISFVGFFLEFTTIMQRLHRLKRFRILLTTLSFVIAVILAFNYNLFTSPGPGWTEEEIQLNRFEPGGEIYGGNLCWTSDGKYLIAVQRNVYDLDVIVQIPVSGGEPKRIAQVPGFIYNPRCSPTGNRLFFFNWDGGTHSPLYVTEGENGSILRISLPQELVADAAWSWDGSQIAYLAKVGGLTRVVRASVGNDTVRYTSVADIPDTSPGRILWAHDDQDLVVTVQYERYWELLVIPVESGKPISFRYILEGHPEAIGWGAQGKSIYLTTSDDDRNRVWRYHEEASGPQISQIAKYPYAIPCPTDETFLSFAIVSERYQLILVDPLKDTYELITTSRRPKNAIVWSPNGKQLAFCESAPDGYLIKILTRR